MIFLDTWAWLALADGSDAYHLPALELYTKLSAERRLLVTTDYVLSEAATAIYPAIGARDAERFLDPLARVDPPRTLNYRRVHITEDLFDRAWQLRRRYADKPDISFVDFTSFVVMQDLGLTDVFTGDDHFRKVGLGFRTLPEP